MKNVNIMRIKIELSTIVKTYAKIWKYKSTIKNKQLIRLMGMEEVLQNITEWLISLVINILKINSDKYIQAVYSVGKKSGDQLRSIVVTYKPFEN